MKKEKLISFDLQGTVSDSAFSDEFWLELLPALHAKKHGVSLDEAKELLEKDFIFTGKYHELFYDHRLRLNEVLPNWTFQCVIRMLSNKPALDLDVLQVIKSIPPHIPKIILSATTRDFIDLELGQAKKYFHATYSTIDDYNTPGKPSSLYSHIADSMGVRTMDCLHIGDCLEMDYENAKNAGWSSFHFNRKLPRNKIITELQKVLNQFIRANR